jgi:beta-phosphoglucomutase-like phosphatase (HAD superfamily)
MVIMDHPMDFEACIFDLDGTLLDIGKKIARGLWRA